MLQIEAVVGWARDFNWCCESDALASAAAKIEVDRMIAAEQAAKAKARVDAKAASDANDANDAHVSCTLIATTCSVPMTL
jgi:hypothetical protein